MGAIWSLEMNLHLPPPPPLSWVERILGIRGFESHETQTAAAAAEGGCSFHRNCKLSAQEAADGSNKNAVGHFRCAILLLARNRVNRKCRVLSKKLSGKSVEHIRSCNCCALPRFPAKSPKAARNLAHVYALYPLRRCVITHHQAAHKDLDRFQATLQKTTKHVHLISSCSSSTSAPQSCRRA